MQVSIMYFIFIVCFNRLLARFTVMMSGAFQVDQYWNILSGYRHSAAITEDGKLYTWGEGDHGRLGHGDGNGRQIPTLVHSLNDVGSVACGSSHTLVVSQDGKNVWSFGSGEHGKLGHGEIAKVFKPKLIEALQGLTIQKVCAGTTFSMALTTSGRVSIDTCSKIWYMMKRAKLLKENFRFLWIKFNFNSVLT